MKPIAIFYHCLFFHGDPPELRERAFEIVHDQMKSARENGLVDAAAEMHVGINGGEETKPFADMVIPSKANRIMHGLASKAENLTLVALENWLPSHPDWYVLYFHAKGATHVPGDYAEFSKRWSNCMMRNLVQQWRRCVQDLDNGFESVGCHWMTGLGSDKSQNIWAGNFWWAKSDFLATLPSIFKRDRIKQSGIAAAESRFEAEVWIGNGSRLPLVKDYHAGGIGQCP